MIHSTFSNRITSLGSNLYGLLITMRPQQWTKNGIVFAALVFDGKLMQPDLLLRTLLGALCFCLVASSVYIVNDLVDIEKDRQHPRKRLRPLPSGQLNPSIAMLGAAGLMLIGISLALWLEPWVALIIAVYLGQNFAYSLWLKHVVLIDVMVLAFGFLLRVLAGVFIVQVTNFSPWLYVCVTLLALFLGFGKRRHEITLLTTNAAQHRASLAHYNLPLLDQIIGLVTATTLVAYTFYTFEAKTAVMHDGRMLFTVPFVFYFIVRYLYLIHVENRGGAPDELLLKDRHLLITSLLWMVTTVGLIYVIPATL